MQIAENEKWYGVNLNENFILWAFVMFLYDLKPVFRPLKMGRK